MFGRLLLCLTSKAREASPKTRNFPARSLAQEVSPNRWPQRAFRRAGTATRVGKIINGQPAHRVAPRMREDKTCEEGRDVAQEAAAAVPVAS